MDNLGEANKKESVYDLNKLKEKSLIWIKQPFNAAFVALIIFTITLRLYYFILTQNQALWWDEADYMMMAKHWAFGYYYEFAPVRPILFSFIAYIFLKIANNEFLPRLFLEVLSVFSVVGVYYLGKELYDKKVGLIAGLFMSAFFLNIFFSQRLLNDLISLTFFVCSAYFFYKYLNSNSNKALYIAAFLTGIGTVFRINTAFILIVFGIYLLFTEKLRFIKKREIWISAGIFILTILPYILWGYYKFGGFVIAMAGTYNAAKTNYISTGLTVLKTYILDFPRFVLSIDYIPTNTSLIWIVTFGFLAVLSIIYIINFLLRADLVLKENKKSPELYVILLFLVPLILTSFSIAHNEDRYVLNSFSGFFIILASFLMYLHSKVVKKGKYLALALVIIILGAFVYVQIQAGYNLTMGKYSSYSQVKDAGIWIKQNSKESDLIISNSALQLQYYADRRTLFFNATEENYLGQIKEQKPKYLVVTGFETIPEWVKTYPERNNLSLANVIYMDKTQNNPIVIIYRA